MLLFKEYLSESCDCWKGYKRKPGTKPCAPGSCIKESVELDEALDPSEVAGNPKMYDASTVKKAYYHKSVSANDKESLARHLDRHHGNKEWRKSVKEELSLDEQFDLIEQYVEELSLSLDIHTDVIWEKFELVDDVELYEAAVDAKGHKSSTGGLTQKGRDAYNAKGANLQAPVTTPPSKLKAGSKAANRRRSFCARMGGMEGPMKDDKGRPTRKALALRKWNC